MINVLLLNNTENYHSGCKQVIQYFRDHFSEENLVIFDKKNKTLPNYTDFDLIILNGEGSVHDDSKKMIKYLEYMNSASKNNVVTMFVNSVWQKNSKETVDLLKNIDYISVRETLSKNEILNFIDRIIDVKIDLSYFINVPYIKKTSNNIVSGNRFLQKKERKLFDNLGETSYIDIFQQSWNEIVNTLRHSKLLITGRHHEMYAACKADCKFIALEGNTHKNLGLIKTYNSNIPVLPIEATNDEILNLVSKIDQYQLEFDNLFDNMKNEEPPNFLNIYRLIKEKK